jgi:exosortase B
MLAAFAAVALPTYWDLAQLVWSTEEQSHGPVVMAVAFWLLWVRRAGFIGLQSAPEPVLGGGVLAIGAVLYALGRSQALIQAEVLAHLFFLSAAILLLRGRRGLRLLWFPLFFLLFTIPLPGVLVQAVTLPLKSAVSYVVEVLLHWADYPVARSGVILTVGHYQLLVADACAGLTSIFTLEAFGLLYMHVMGYTDRTRNTLLALLVVPCAFAANVIRVVILVLITYYFGDAAGQGFVHQFAGIVLFSVALVLLMGCDRLVGLVPSLSNERGLAAAARP